MSKGYANGDAHALHTTRSWEISWAIIGYRRAESISLAVLVDASARTLRSGSLAKHRKGGDVARHVMTKIVGLLADDPRDL